MINLSKRQLKPKNHIKQCEINQPLLLFLNKKF